MQYELDINDWRKIDEAIKWDTNYRWVEVWNGKEIKVAHFAQDLSGEEQPPFSGWFFQVGPHSYHGVWPEPYRWRHLCPQSQQDLVHSNA